MSLTLPDTIRHFNQEDFINLLEYILDCGLGAIHCSTRSDLVPPGAALIAPERLDFCLTGAKDIRFPAHGIIRQETLRPTDLHFSPPFTWKLPLWTQFHQMASIIYNPTFIRLTYIDYNARSTYFMNNGAIVFYHTSSPLPLYARELLNALNHMAEDNIPQDDMRPVMTVLLRATLEALAHDQQQPVDKSKHTFWNVDNFLHDNFLTPITRESVARTFQLTPSYLSKLYAQYAPRSFNQTLRTLRLEHAAMLLKNTTQSLDEITLACGYESTPFLITAFRKQYGISPGKYRRQFS